MTQLLRIQEAKEENASKEKKTRGRTWYVAVGVLLVIGLLAVIALAAPTIKSLTSSTPDPVPSTQFVGTPPVADLNHIVPADTQWILEGTTAVPKSKDAGPTSTKDIASGFARTPAGALFSLSWFSSEVWSPEVDKTTLLNQRMINTTGYEGMFEVYAPKPTVQTATPTIYQIAAYRLLSYTPDSATIILVQRTTGGANPGFLLAVTYNLRWDGDWKIVPPPDGQYHPVQVLQGLSGMYQPFQGV
jgi:hypothetical protein